MPVHQILERGTNVLVLLGQEVVWFQRTLPASGWEYTILIYSERNWYKTTRKDRQHLIVIYKVVILKNFYEQNTFVAVPDLKSPQLVLVDFMIMGYMFGISIGWKQTSRTSTPNDKTV